MAHTLARIRVSAQVLGQNPATCTESGVAFLKDVFVLYRGSLF